ncbi:MAG: PadR family transcriptional regulator [Prevotella sp.]|nr:PadR family transcriptional regulator [Prevotella sp.]
MTEITILNLLSTRPMYGVEMIEEIKRLSGNAVVMSLPTLYSSLHRMADKKLVNSYQRESAIGGRCRVYNITKSGREYLAKNPIKIDYTAIADSSALAHKTFATLEEAFSLPLNKKPLLPQELPENKRVLQITPPPPPVAPASKPTPKISPYIAPTEKIVSTPEPQYQQTSIGLSGTVGGNDLRPLLKLNSITVGNDYVTINRLRMVVVALNAVIFMLINFFCSLSHTVQTEYYTLVYIALLLYICIQLAVYLFFPRIKTVFKRKSIGIRHALISLVLLVFVLAHCLFNHATNLLWLLIFALLPMVEFVLMLMLHKRSYFLC